MPRGQSTETPLEPLSEWFEREARPALMAFFLRRTGHRSDAEDLTQEVFIRLIHRAGGPVQSEMGYLFTIAVNLLRDRGRRDTVRERYAHGVSLDRPAHADPLDPQRIAEGREAVMALVSGLQRLPERTRTIFLLYRYEQMSHAEIARTLGLSISAIEKHVRRAYLALVETVGDQG